MTKNKLEKKFSEAIKADSSLWGMKLHNNPLSHQNTPADYILNMLDINYQLELMLVECKQVTLKEGKGRFAFKRFKQLHDCLSFENFRVAHHAYLCLVYKDQFWRDSEVYMIPVKVMRNFIESWSMVSVNRSDAKANFYKYRVIDFKIRRSFEENQS